LSEIQTITLLISDPKTANLKAYSKPIAEINNRSSSSKGG
jgi:hypothetical protein